MPCTGNAPVIDNLSVPIAGTVGLPDLLGSIWCNIVLKSPLNVKQFKGNYIRSNIGTDN